VLTGRNGAKGKEALDRIKARCPAAVVNFEFVDLASLSSVAALAERVRTRHPILDLLVNNAGVMAVPNRLITPDGFELQFATNYLSHFALTARLLGNLLRAGAPRVVTVSSLAHAMGKISLDDLQSERAYRPYQAYAMSKLATLIFAFELQRRSTTNGWNILSVAAHPGWSATSLQTSGPRIGRSTARFSECLTKLLSPLFAQSAAQGALPTLFAATMPHVGPGTYYGPDGWREMKGFPKLARIAAQALDCAMADRFWTVSERLTGVAMSIGLD
jgi:NAD(P)-dependent dehydrogenase (short-subunit alcohol dehydrogenase family)